MKVKKALATIFISTIALNFFSITTDANAKSLAQLLPNYPQNFAKTTLPDDIATKFLENDLTMYDPLSSCIPTGKFSGKGISGSCGGDIIGDNSDDRLEQVIQNYGSLAMNLQITYGISWELMLAQFYSESGVGLAGTAAAQAQDGKFNWLGMKHSSSHHYGNDSYTNYPYPTSEGIGYYESYDSIEEMMKAYASGDILRNGAYDDAFQYTDKDNYDLASFARTMGSTYCCTSYGDTIMNETLPKVRAIAKKLGLPTTEELQKQQNIPIGGKFPIGTPVDQIYDDSVTCSNISNTSSSNNNTTSSSSNNGNSGSSNSSNNINDGGKNIVYIGDSISVLSEDALKQKLPNAEYHTQSSKSFWVEDSSNPDGISILKGLDLNGKDIVIFALGTNNGASGVFVTPDKAQQVLDIAGKNRTVVFVTNYGNGIGAYDTNNNIFKDLASKNSNVVIADWAAAVSNDPNKYIPSGDVHPIQGAGTDLWADTILSAISSGNTSSCTVSADRQIVVEAAKKSAGKSFYTVGNPVYGMSIEDAKNYDGSGGFDCNSFVWWAWAQAGVELLHGSGSEANGYSESSPGQWQQAKASGRPIKENIDELLPGDEIFYFDPNGTMRHVALYVGDGNIVEAASPSHPTPEERSIDSANYYGGGWKGWSPIDDSSSSANCSSKSTTASQDICTTSLGGASDTGNGGCYDENNFPSYTQGDPEWSGLDFHGFTIGSAGCGPTSLAEIVTILTGQRITPADVVNNGYGNSVYNSISELDPEFVGRHGLETEVFTVTDVSSGIETMKKYLQGGWMIHTGGNANRSTGTCVNSISTGCSGHYVSLLKIDNDGKVTHTDINDDAGYGNAKHTLEELFEMGLYTDGHPSVAIRRSDSSGSASNCNSDGQLIDESGLTLEEATQLAKNYGANKNDSSKNAAGEGQWFIGCNGNSNGNGGSNCVTFSAFFANKFGKQDDYNSWQDGINTVNDLATLGVKTGSTPKVWSVFSGGEAGTHGHTGVIVGYHDNSWIVIQASCSNSGSGAGDGTGEFSASGKYSSGAAWASAVPDLTVNQYGPTIGNGSINTTYAYLDVDTKSISEYLKNGE